MAKSAVTVRLMKAEDFDAVLGIDEKVLNTSRREYYEMKFEKLFDTKDYLPASLVAVNAEGTVVGFVMGETYIGQFGIFQQQATLDTIGVDPDCRGKGVGKLLIDEFVDHLKKMGVQKVRTMVGWNDPELMPFFSANQFSPSKTVNLERVL